ncbi:MULTISPECIES: hypothetical protein [unclassified Marinitoga]|uniref:hypothetical protein n=1 Tax=unclassified Marinitoga TaxID=2640159 RepID=UPI0006416944|nr:MULTISPECIES: hypothetical protein [unclassified Marinitoga]KLO23956.1 hypothetical protein X274_05145 [Marinitoga sp. 1155]NUU99098.1 hypothetical protein [Marinitoga sp. 1154]
MNTYSLILIISLIIVGIVFNLIMINYIYKNSIYRKNIFKNELKLITDTETYFSEGKYNSEIIYVSPSATLIKITFENGIEGIRIQEE